MSELSIKWICENHGFDTIKKWVTSLKLFRFVRAVGGHANDGDEFVLLIEYLDIAHLKEILRFFSIELNEIPPDYNSPKPGVPYKYIEFSKFKSEIKEHPGFEQPGKVKLLNREVFIFVGNNLIKICVTNLYNPYIVTDEEFQYCMKLENYLISNFDLNYSYCNDKFANYISKSKYPVLFD